VPKVHIGVYSTPPLPLRPVLRRCYLCHRPWSPLHEGQTPYLEEVKLHRPAWIHPQTQESSFNPKVYVSEKGWPVEDTIFFFFIDFPGILCEWGFLGFKARDFNLGVVVHASSQHSGDEAGES
jgi:hypothetical protein